MRALYAALAVGALATGAWLRLVAQSGLPWWVLAGLAVLALSGFAHALVRTLTRRAAAPGVGVLDSLGRPSRRWLWTGAAAAVLGWVLGISAGAVHEGQPSADGTGSCRYALVDSGQRTCITADEYEVAVARAQSMGFGAAAFFLGFAVVAVGRSTPPD